MEVSGYESSPARGVMWIHGSHTLAPGATAESTGTSEIEIQISGEGISTSVVGTAGDDEFRWGAGGAGAGLNVNPGAAGDDDVDVTVTGGPDDVAPLLVADGAAGNDTITGDPTVVVRNDVSARGGPGNDVLSTPRGGTGRFLRGGPGNDVITGGAFADALMGDAGSDRIVGGGGSDKITGGSGSDRIFGGAGRDFIKVRDDARDIVECGAGRDRVSADRRDRVIGCERISGR